MFEIRREQPQDVTKIREVIKRAFGQEQEASVVEKLRQNCNDIISLVAVVEYEVVGHILFSPTVIEGEHRNIVGSGLAPLAVLPEYQGQGIATAAARLVVESVTKLRIHRFIFAYPSVDNHPSNAICRKLGFKLIGDRDFEYPPGNILHCNIWRLDLLKIN